MTLLEVRDLTKQFVARRNLLGRPVEVVDAVKGVSFDLAPGTTLGIVGETGAGKSTVGRLVLRLVEPTSGSVRLLGEDVLRLSHKELRQLRRRAQMIFQDPFSSLDPRMVIADAVAEPLTIHEQLSADEREARVVDLLERVGLRADHLDRYPREFSGGQLQRIAIARAIATNPEVIVCDEPVAALDVSIQAQVLNLLLDLQNERGMGYLFISHDLALVRILADEVAVMWRGALVERGPVEQIFEQPDHSYTKELLAAMPVARPRRPKARSARVAGYRSSGPPGARSAQPPGVNDAGVGLVASSGSEASEPTTGEARC